MKRTIALLLALMMCLTLCACGVDSSDIIGVWNGSWEYNGVKIKETIIFDEEGQCIVGIYRDGMLDDEKVGTYECDGSTVSIITYNEDEMDNVTTKFNYKDDTLINNGHELIKLG